MCDIIFYILETVNTWKTKIYMLDIAKKLIIKNPDINSVQEIQHYFFRYYHYNNKKNIVRTPEGIYNYYNLELPIKEDIDRCILTNSIF